MSTTTTTSTATTTATDTVRLPKPANLKELKPSPVFDVSTATDERTKTLGQLLQKGHVTVAPLREPELILHSHLPHVRRNLCIRLDCAKCNRFKTPASRIRLCSRCGDRTANEILRA